VGEEGLAEEGLVDDEAGEANHGNAAQGHLQLWGWGKVKKGGGCKSSRRRQCQSSGIASVPEGW
jgi:hypothetical protein